MNWIEGGITVAREIKKDVQDQRVPYIRSLHADDRDRDIDYNAVSTPLFHGRIRDEHGSVRRVHGGKFFKRCGSELSHCQALR